MSSLLVLFLVFLKRNIPALLKGHTSCFWLSNILPFHFGVLQCLSLFFIHLHIIHSVLIREKWLLWNPKKAMSLPFLRIHFKMQNNRCDQHFWHQHDDKMKDKGIDIDTPAGTAKMFWIIGSSLLYLNSSIVWILNITNCKEFQKTKNKKHKNMTRNSNDTHCVKY